MLLSSVFCLLTTSSEFRLLTAEFCLPTIDLCVKTCKKTAVTIFTRLLTWWDVGAVFTRRGSIWES